MTDVRLALQHLRDASDRQCGAAANRNDRDSADAWERIGLALDGVQKAIAADWRTIESRRPLGATVRDYARRQDIVKAVEDGRDTIISCWDEWDGFAGQQAQIEQDGDAWFGAMHSQLEAVLYGILDQIADIGA